MKFCVPLFSTRALAIRTIVFLRRVRPLILSFFNPSNGNSTKNMAGKPTYHHLNVSYPLRYRSSPLQNSCCVAALRSNHHPPTKIFLIHHFCGGPPSPRRRIHKVSEFCGYSKNSDWRQPTRPTRSTTTWCCTSGSSPGRANDGRLRSCSRHTRWANVRKS